VFNHYGPTEATVGCVVFEIEIPPTGPVPIGRPISNAKLYVLDSRRRPVGIGVTGEIYIGGAGVARGYLNRLDLTAERFVKDPFSADESARMYRTGDLGRWRADGNVEFLGRNDHQVKIRGYRVELGEIESQIRAHEGIQEVAVIAREDTPGDKRLVAYYSAAPSIETEKLRAHLKEKLPEYMWPAAFVKLERLPLTANGKLDRKALPAPDMTALSTQEYEAPQGEIEATLANIWKELLNVERVGRRDDFFDLGGHSLLAVQLITRVRAVLGRDLALRDLFMEPTIRQLAPRLSDGAQIVLEPIGKADRTAPIPLSHAQQRLWFVDRFEAAGAAYHIAGALKLDGPLDSRALRSALNAIIQRHEILRTTFVQRDGNPVQVISPAAPFALKEVDLSTHAPAARAATFEEHAAEIATTRFDLSIGPLIRGRLLQYGDQEHVLLIAMHHIVSDGWSLGVLMKELGVLYSAASEGSGDPLPPLAIQYADYAAWQRNGAQREAEHTQLKYWREQLAGMPTLLELPSDRLRPPVQSFRGGSIPFVMDETATARLNELSSQHDVTLFMTLYAGYALLMSRLSGQGDIVIGSPLANRPREEVEPLVGFFVNTLPLRIRVDDDPSVRELLARVKEMTLAAYGHQHVPFEQIVEAVRPPRSLSHSPLYQVSLTWGNTPNSHFTLPGLKLSRVEVPHDTSQIDLSLILREEDGRIIGNAMYAADLFDRSTVERWMRHLQTVLAEMVKDAAQPVSRVALLGEVDRRALLAEFNSSAVPVSRDLLVHELFEQQVDRDPAAVALSYEGQQLSYAELNRRANQLARYLRERGVRADTLIAICMDRSVEMIVSLLGVLKAGAAYVPLDPAYPEDRLAYLLEDAGAPVLLTLSRMEDELPVCAAQVIAVDRLRPELEQRDDTNLPRTLTEETPGHLAYVIYTSGSTGRPKGVMVEHRNLVNLIDWHCAAFDLRAGDRSSSIAGLGFDATVWEIWTTLCAGATLVLPTSSVAGNLDTLLEWWRRQRLDISFLPTPAAEFAFNRGIDNAGLKTLLVGGDQLRYRAPASSPYRLINNYGLTETTVVATSGHLDAAEATAHIGRPIANTNIYILDSHLQPVPIGVVGEIHVGGASVARGYLNRDELTNERFLHDPFSATPAARMYKTGDLGKWRADGNIEFCGRSDHQVKIRGYRVEPGEIEAGLSRHPDVKEAVVVVREDELGEKRLVAYVTYAGESPSADTLRTHLKSFLPGHMIPAAFVPMSALPMTPNGKVDRAALPAPDSSAYALKPYELPLGATEVALASIWQDLLRLERVGRHDSFFELGGHSLLAVQATSRISQTFQIDASLAEIFDSPSVAAMAEVVVSRQLEQFDPADIARVSAQVAVATVA
ncbi:MAG TPA: amino acid adenylation domain-containing protein, partial [Steroidobacteraceae bacterium]|nr:amino acid adenylation domain-containing protein [Steroidobacteraceae bacterium]